MKKPNERTRPKKSKEKLEEKKKSGIPGLPFSSEIAELGKELKLSEHDVFLLVWLRAAMNEKTENKKCWKSEATLADEMRCSRQTIARAVKDLREKGLITVRKLGERKGFIQRNIYSINYPWPYISHDSHRVMSMTPTESRACSSQSHDHDSNRVINQSGLMGKGNKLSSIRRKIQIDDDSLLTQKTKEIGRRQTKTKNNGSSAVSHLGIKIISFPPRGNDRWSYAKANEFDFGVFVAPYRDRRDLDAPLASHIEDQIEAFYDSMLSAHWNKKHERPGSGMKRLFFRACRNGAGERFGLVFRSLEQFEENRKEEERLTAESHRRREEENARRMKEEEADARRRKEEDEKKRKREAFKKLISEKQVQDLLKFMCISLPSQPEHLFREQARQYLNGIMKGSGAKNKKDLIKACEKELVHRMGIRKSDERMIARS